MSTQSLKCNYKFSRGAPRGECGLPAGPDGLCVFHSEELSPNFIQSLVQEVSNHGHWLEGALIKQDLIGVHLVDAKMPKANFEGRKLINVVLTGALLKKANFRSTYIENSIFNNCNLSNCVFDSATIRGVDGYPVDFSNAELGGVSFTGSILKSLRLLRARFSTTTRIESLLDMPCFEMEAGSWDDAATIYATLGKRAAEDWDFASGDLCSYIAMTCRHRKAIKAGALPERNQLINWVSVSFRAGPVGWLWLGHRIIWGYSLRPLRTLFTMLLVIVLFSLIFFFITGTNPNNITFIDTIILSLTTFVTLGGYNKRSPFGTMGEFLGGVEALLGIILLDLFLISLVGKYIRRF